MIDDDDVGWFALIWDFDSPLLAVLGIVIMCVLAYVACQNDDECSRMHCDHGTPQLVHHECICTERAK